MSSEEREIFSVFDSHCHLDSDDYDPDREAVLERARAAGVEAVLCPGTDVASSERVLSLCAAVQPGDVRLWAAVGIHPHSATEASPAGETDPSEILGGRALTRVRSLAQAPGVVGIGETGLDYHYNFSPPSLQRASMRAHVRLAVELDLPLVLHCRAGEDKRSGDAERDLLGILDEEGRGSARGVVHCYSGTPETARALLDRGFYLGFTGVITFKKAETLREIMREVPLDRILVETDGPYLAPLPYRGKRNEPAYVALVAAAAARVRGLSAPALAALAFENTVRCFGLPPQAQPTA